MKFTIFQVENGFLLNVVYSKSKSKSFIYTPKERMTMFATIDKLCGEEPENSTGMKEEDNETD